MKNRLFFFGIIIVVCFGSCVQKTVQKTVVFTLDVSDVKNVKKVGIRGSDKPLSWDYDTEMRAIKKDTLYKISITGKTGYKFTEIKFVVNDTFELQNEDNRRVMFTKKDTTFYTAKFNKQ